MSNPFNRGPRYEHAWLMRAEGAKLREIGAALGVGKQRARMIVMAFGREMSVAMKRTQISIEETSS